MAQSQQDYDDNYGVPDPDEVLSQQQAAYAQSQRDASAGARSSASIAQGLINFGGGGQQMDTARRVQARMQEIMSGVTSNSDPNEDPLTAQMRMASAMQRGLIDVSPKAAMAAGDQLVKLSQAKQQQSLLDTRQKVEQQNLSDTTFKSNIERNTPHMVYLATDQGTDDKGLALGYKQLGAFDANDPDAGPQLRAAMQSAKDQGLQAQVMNEDQMAQMKLKVSQDNYARTVQAAMINAQQRAQAAADKAASPGGNSINDRYTDRVLNAGELGIGSIEAIARLPFGTSRGLFVDGSFSHAGQSFMSMTGENLRNELTNTDSQMYNVFTAGLGTNLAALEMGGLGTGLAALATQIQNKIQIKPGDSPIAIMSKLGEVRDSIDRGTATKMADPRMAQAKKDELQKMLDRLHTAVPFTRLDVVDFDAANQKDKTLTFTEWAAKNNLGQSGANAPPDPTKPPRITDSRGVTALEQF